MASLNAEQRENIWKALDKLSRHHKGFPDAKWALPESDIAEIEAVAKKFQPADLVGKYRFLFDDQMPDIGTKRTDAEYQSSLGSERIRAIREIATAEGPAGIQRLLDETKEAFLVGWTVAESGIDIKPAEVMTDLDSENDHRMRYAMGYVRQRSNKDGLAWVDSVLPELGGRPMAQARVLRMTPVYPNVWERAAKLGEEVESRYWQEFLPIGLGTDFEFLNQAAQKLLQYGRPGTATDMLAMYADRTDPPATPDTIAEALEALVEAPEEEQRRVSPYELNRLLEVLRATTIDENRLGVIEWRVLPGLGYGTPAATLERRLARDPAFFVQILSMCFKRADGTSEQGPNPGVAQNAFHLLHDWRVVPGSTERGGEVDAVKLGEWLDGALRLLVESDRLAIGATYIGHVFAHAKEDPDETWPTKNVRDAIERLAKDEVERGFGIQIYNNRGVTSRGLTDGGRQERGLAERFERWESLIRDSWPRTAAVLRSVAQGYRAQAQAEDEEAERFKKGLDPF